MLHPTRRQALVTALLAGAGAPIKARAQTAAQRDIDAALQAALAGAHRSAANRARDSARHPQETLRFLGLEPAMTVVELAPGGGWYTEVLAPVLRERGRLIAAHYAPDSADEGRRRSRAGFEAKLAKEPALYDRVVVGTLPRTPAFADPPLAEGSADMVLTFRNVHNWLEDGHLDATLAACHRALKPGGMLGVEEHRAAPGTALAQMMKSGYVTEAVMEERARAAGFVLAARSEINANPRDTKDHPNGVWSLPPTLRGAGVDQPAERARLLAIGESDRFTHRYVKRAGA